MLHVMASCLGLTLNFLPRSIENMKALSSYFVAIPAVDQLFVVTPPNVSPKVDLIIVIDPSTGSQLP